jgi:cytoskeletal protein CcmA (bactofilin family)
MPIFGSKTEQKAAPQEAPPKPVNSMNKQRTPSETPAQINMVGKGVTIEGTIKVKGDVRVGGRIKGEVDVDSKIVVAEEGVVEGIIRTTDGDIAGKIKGDVFAKERLMIRQSAVVEGKIHATKLAVEDGAVLIGQCEIGPAKGSSPSPSVSKPEPAAKPAEPQPASAVR